jgi:hypothetical protein
LSAISGPIPAGSPVAMAIRGKFMVVFPGKRECL